MSASSVLYDLPGPKAIVRNRIIGVVTVIVALGFLGFILYRFQATGQFTAQKWDVFTYANVWRQVWEATLRTLSAFALAGALSMALGLVLAIGRLSDHAWVSRPFVVAIEIFRAVPVLILMMLMYYGLPVLGQNWVTPFLAVVIALTVYNGSVLAEAIRAGVESLARGQSEAAYAIGLRKSGVMSYILLPQAIRAMLPVIIAQLVVCLKDTALGFIITYEELLYLGRFIGSSAQLGSPIIPAAIVISVIYISLCLALSGLAKWVEVKTRKSAKVEVAVEANPPVAQV